MICFCTNAEGPIRAEMSFDWETKSSPPLSLPDLVMNLYSFTCHPSSKQRQSHRGTKHGRFKVLTLDLHVQFMPQHALLLQDTPGTWLW